jgi:hypothetical protein
MHVKGGFFIITLHEGLISLHKFFKEDLVNLSIPERPAIRLRMLLMSQNFAGVQECIHF